MKTCRTHISLLFLLFAHVALLAAVVPRSFDLKGRIDGENIRFELEIGYADLARGDQGGRGGCLKAGLHRSFSPVSHKRLRTHRILVRAPRSVMVT